MRLIKERKISGKGILIAGQPGTGKTALALGLSLSLGSDIPFVSITGSEVFSVGISKIETLRQAFRKAISVRIREEVEVIEGEVVDITIERDSSGHSSNSKGRLTIKTTDMETVYELGNRMVEAFSKERIQSGDVITIDKSNGKLTKLGRSFSRARDFDTIGNESRFVACPDGELQRVKELYHTVSLHEIDAINSKSNGFLSIFSGDTGEIKMEVREQIRSKILDWCSAGKADIIPGVIFIDEAHMLDVECFSFINRAIEEDFSPLVILATNRGFCKVRGSIDEVSPHGLPLDLLDRLLIISTTSYSDEDIKNILMRRAQEEDIQLSDAACDFLVATAKEGSLRYSMQLLTVSSLISARSKNPTSTIDEIEVRRAYKLFFDHNRSIVISGSGFA